MRTGCVLLVCCAGLAACVLLEDAVAQGTRRSYEPLLRRLREHSARMQVGLTRDVGQSPECVELMLARFDATRAICDEIDRLGPGETVYVQDLYSVLGVVKDPASIDWLQAKARSAHANYIYTWWLVQWTRHDGGVYDTSTHLTIKWIAETDRWRRFLTGLLDQTTDQLARTRLLLALARCFHDKDAIQFFIDAEDKLSGSELLIVQAYLLQHGRPINVFKLNKCIESLTASEEGQVALYRFAEDGRHEAVVPWVISLVGRRSERWATPFLRTITFQQDLTTKKQWQTWYQENRTSSREQWIKSALDEFEVTLAKDVAAARRILDSGRWIDPSIAPRVRKWLEYKELHPEIARWIVMSYHPYWRDQLEPIAERVVRESWQRLDWYGSKGLRQLDFVPGKGLTWQEVLGR